MTEQALQIYQQLPKTGRVRLFTKTVGHRNAGASGSADRSSWPDSVRHMSVTTAAQRRLLTGDDTR
jgi:hypothetical protein